jgi:hypothetical protein
MRFEQPPPREPLQHFRHQLDRNVVLLGDFARARGRLIRPQRQVLHRDQRVVSLL